MLAHQAPRRCRLVIVATCALVIAWARPAPATTVLPLDLDQMTAAADRVFLGRVVAVRTGRDAQGLPSTWTTFTVEEAIKGATSATVEIKQLGVDAPLADGTVFRIPSLPSYRVGEELILFLHPDSGAGFTSPVGLGQGRFRVHHRAGGAVAENDVGNANLATPASGGGAPSARARALTGAPSAPSGAIPVDDLLARVRAITGAAR